MARAGAQRFLDSLPARIATHRAVARWADRARGGLRHRCAHPRPAAAAGPFARGRRQPARDDVASHAGRVVAGAQHAVRCARTALDRADATGRRRQRQPVCRSARMGRPHRVHAGFSRGSRTCTTRAPAMRKRRVASAAWRPQPIATFGGAATMAGKSRNAWSLPGHVRGATQRHGSRGASVMSCASPKPIAAASARACRTLPAWPSLRVQHSRGSCSTDASIRSGRVAAA